MPDEEIELSAESQGIQADPPDYEVVGGEDEETVAEKIKKMREDLKICRKDKDEYLAGWQRAKADFINARKEEERSRETFVKFAQASVLLEFLKVTDSLEMAMKHGPDSGIKQIYAQTKEILKQHGVTEIKSEGMKFNPALHEAIDKAEVDDLEKENIIIEELQKGWHLHDKVLRPAKVKVGVHTITNN